MHVKVLWLFLLVSPTSEARSLTLKFHTRRNAGLPIFFSKGS